MEPSTFNIHCQQVLELHQNPIILTDADEWTSMIHHNHHLVKVWPASIAVKGRKEDELARLERHLRERTAEERTSSYQSNLSQPDIPATASLPVERSTTALELETPVDLGVLGELNAATIYDRETYHLGRMIIRALSMNDDQTPNVPSSRPSLLSATFLQDAELQPRRVPLGLLSLYLDNYFRHVHPTFPMLSENTVRQCLRTLCSVSNLASAAADRVVLYLVLALGSLLSDEESSYDSCYSARFFHSALQEKLTYRETIDTVHILILFTLYSLFDTNAGSSWHLVDLAMRTSIILGLHHSGSSSSDAVASSDADPTNDVTFWSLYLLDRWISLALAQPVTLPNFEIRTRFTSTSQAHSTPFQRLCYWAFKSRILVN
ncbi:hypothetical protein LTR06_001564 [Exophiala xenobiotica]|nr:hypothetical protein LTR06_001564 [Exophiala xenobiotica]